MLKGTTEKVNSMHEKLGNFSREKYWKSNGKLEIKNVVIDKKKCFLWAHQ